MKTTHLPLLAALLLAPAVWAQDRIYRCGNEYTNNVSQAKERGCKLVEGGNVTVLGTTPSRSAGAGGAASGGSSTSPATAPKVDSNDQRARDADARAILESELRKAEARRADLAKEYNNGAPERNALDLRNPQSYAERTAELKASLARAESDIAGIKRELARLPGGAATANQ
jgi:hypothetical protein